MGFITKTPLKNMNFETIIIIENLISVMKMFKMTFFNYQKIPLKL